jgi:hypothetical protein
MTATSDEQAVLVWLKLSDDDYGTATEQKGLEALEDRPERLSQSRASANSTGTRSARAGTAC